MPKVRVAALATALVLSLASVGERGTRPLPQQARPGSILSAPSAFSTATPIQHLVVIYQENESFDHYFGLYPRAMNPPGEPAFHPAPATTHPNGLTTALVTHNPNGVNPRRLNRAQLFPCSNDHSYTGEQQAFDRGRMDRFVHPAAPGCTYGSTMDYYDGNTVTALWNYAHRFSMSDNSHDATFGPTLLGHLNLAAGQTHGAVVTGGTTGAVVNGTLIGNANAQYEDCGPATGPKVAMSGRNVGDLLSSARVSWGYFSAGFRPSSRNPDSTAVCDTLHSNLAGHTYRDYIAGAGTEPFQFWSSTANPHHLPPSSAAEIGNAGPANHQYDLTDFWTAADAGLMPAVSFIKPPAAANGHPGNCDPLDEQQFLVRTINRIQNLTTTWPSTAIVIAYDDSDGWYDHVMTQPLNSSSDPVRDTLTSPGHCGSGAALGGYLDRCGPGPRQPLLVISPYSRINWIDHALTTQVSITRFIEDNWLRGQRLGGGSFDATAGSLLGLFDLVHPRLTRLLLDPPMGLQLPH